MDELSIQEVSGTRSVYSNELRCFGIRGDWNDFGGHRRLESWRTPGSERESPPTELGADLQFSEDRKLTDQSSLIITMMKHKGLLRPSIILPSAMIHPSLPIDPT